MRDKHESAGQAVRGLNLRLGPGAVRRMGELP